ncbi:MAG TPA: HD domain-containing protein [Candidatus Saccharimonadales bacterium]|nr:HD domain-containing protein [Candidatus Saccharimonadales bacterium]
MKNDHSKQAEELLKQLEFLFEKYSNEPRAMTQPYILQRVMDKVVGYKYHPDDILVRETLMEHVGSLPVFATAFYPHIQDDNVDLGRALIMIAIHDIGELITHDEMSFTKQDSAKDPEHEAALSLLDKSYHGLYEDVESQTSPTAKFAKAIDKITPDILEYFSPADITLRRYKHFLGLENIDEIIELIEKKKQPYMQWNPFMTTFHKLLLEKLSAKLKA